MFRRIVSLPCIVLILLLTACGPAGAKLTADENGSKIEVKAGDLIVVSLAGNPTTGYTWEASNLDTSFFEQVGETEFKSDNPGLAGAGGTLTLTFKAIRSGTAALTLVYHRPWETDVEPLDTFTVTVTVK